MVSLLRPLSFRDSMPGVNWEIVLVIIVSKSEATGRSSFSEINFSSDFKESYEKFISENELLPVASALETIITRTISLLTAGIRSLQESDPSFFFFGLSAAHADGPDTVGVWSFCRWESAYVEAFPPHCTQ